MKLLPWHVETCTKHLGKWNQRDQHGNRSWEEESIMAELWRDFASWCTVMKSSVRVFHLIRLYQIDRVHAFLAESSKCGKWCQKQKTLYVLYFISVPRALGPQPSFTWKSGDARIIVRWDVDPVLWWKRPWFKQCRKACQNQEWPNPKSYGYVYVFKRQSMTWIKSSLTTQIARNEAGTNKAKQFDHQRMCLIRKSHQPSVVRNQESQGIDRGTNIPMAHDHSFPAAPSTAITPRKRRYFCSDKVWLTCNSCNQQNYWTSKPPSQVSPARVKGGPFLPGLMIKSIPLGCWDWFQVQLLTANYEWCLVRQICRHNVFQTGVWLGIVEVEVE